MRYHTGATHYRFSYDPWLILPNVPGGGVFQSFRLSRYYLLMLLFHCYYTAQDKVPSPLAKLTCGLQTEEEEEEVRTVLLDLSPHCI